MGNFDVCGGATPGVWNAVERLNMSRLVLGSAPREANELEMQHGGIRRWALLDLRWNPRLFSINQQTGRR